MQLIRKCGLKFQSCYAQKQTLDETPFIEFYKNNAEF